MKKAAIYACEFCGKTYKTKAEAERHERRAHGDWGCQVCEETFLNESDLLRHERTH